jgi:hypothetical protein
VLEYDKGFQGRDNHSDSPPSREVTDDILVKLIVVSRSSQIACWVVEEGDRTI